MIYSYTSGAIHTQLLSVPPWACGFVATLVIATVSEMVGHRFVFAAVPQLIAIAGYIILLAIQQDPNVRYAAMFLVVMDIFMALPVIVCWTTLNVRDQAERSVAVGWIIGFGNVGGTPAAYLFLAEDASKYIPGFAANLAFLACNILVSCAYAGQCYWEN